MRLPSDFYTGDTIEVARALLGKRLVHVLKDGTRLTGRVVETEAYLGVDDDASHSSGGRRTSRNEMMYAAPGTSYIYLIYGMYFCFNVVTAEVGDPQAVLIRAIEPLEGLAQMGRPVGDSPLKMANGPGKLCQALRLERAQNGLDLRSSKELFFEDDGAHTDVEVIDGPRIGLGDRHDAVHWPLRFGISGHPSLSSPRFPLPEP